MNKIKKVSLITPNGSVDFVYPDYKQAFYLDIKLEDGTTKKYTVANKGNDEFELVEEK